MERRALAKRLQIIIDALIFESLFIFSSQLIWDPIWDHHFYSDQHRSRVLISYHLSFFSILYKSTILTADYTNWGLNFFAN